MCSETLSKEYVKTDTCKFLTSIELLRESVEFYKLSFKMKIYGLILLMEYNE